MFLPGDTFIRFGGFAKQVGAEDDEHHGDHGIQDDFKKSDEEFIEPENFYVKIKEMVDEGEDDDVSKEPVQSHLLRGERRFIFITVSRRDQP